MMFCPKCQLEMKRNFESYRYRESGLDNVWLDECPVFICEPCGPPSIGMLDPDRVEREIVRRLVVQCKRLDGPSILFCRKAMGLTGSALADTLKVHRVEVSRWENDRAHIDAMNDFKLRMAAVDKILAELPKDERDGLKMRIASVMQHGYDSDNDIRGVRISIPYESWGANVQVMMS